MSRLLDKPVQQLAEYGPETCGTMSLDEARAWCRTLARKRGENFSVLSALVPPDRRDDFAAVYAFCRWADDLGDEVGDRDRSLELLAWWREELDACAAGAPRHPVFTALEPVIERHELPVKLFDDLIGAFEQDQRVTRYETWAQLIDYCRRSANPVGRLVLRVLGQSDEGAAGEQSDAICTALQLTNHAQDVARDILERDRIYLPSAMHEIEDFEERLRASAAQGYGVDRAFLEESRTLIRGVVDRTWPLYEKGEPLIGAVDRTAAPIIWLFARGGQTVLREIVHWNYETALHRPRLSGVGKLRLVAEAHLRKRCGRFGREKTS